MRRWTTSLFTIVVALAAVSTKTIACPSGTGTPVTIQNASVATLLCDYNAIVDGQFNSSSDTQGPVLIGGNLGPGAVALNDDGVILGVTAGTTAITGYGEVNVFGNQTANNNNAMGHVFVGGTLGAGLTPFGGATSVTSNYAFPPGAGAADNPATFQNDIWSKMTGLSANLAGLSSPSSLSGNTFNGVANADGVAVFNITLAQLNAITGTLSFTGCLAGPTPCDAVINVSGTGTFDQNFSYGALTAAQQNLIWNFESATAVDIDSMWYASIIDTAPNAVVNNTAPIVGNLIATTYGGSAPIGSGELHFFPFDCSDNLCADTPVPEPSSLTLSGPAFGTLMAFAALWRRRARPAVARP
jgi:choice-of-anchor A domain-containing protein